MNFVRIQHKVRLKDIELNKKYFQQELSHTKKHLFTLLVRNIDSKLSD